MPGIAVIGGGDAGIAAARRLDRLLDNRWSIKLVDRSADHQLLTRLPEIVGGRLHPARACVPLRSVLGRRIQVVQGKVTQIDPDRRRVEMTDKELIADWLVITVGSVPHFLGIPEAKEHALVMRSVADAVRFRERVEEELGARKRVHIVIVGAGYTGTEIAGEVADWSKRLRREGSERRLSVQVVAQDERLLPEGNPRLAAIAQRVLESKGVRFSLGTTVFGAERDRLLLERSALEADVILWAVRSEAPPALLTDQWRRGRDGRVRVDPYLRAVGHDRVYLAGDAALVYDYRRDRIASANAQLAVEEGRMVARNLAAEISGRRLHEFRPRLLGEALSLGATDGAAEVTGVVVTRRAALAIKEAALLRYLTSLWGWQLAACYA